MQLIHHPRRGPQAPAHRWAAGGGLMHWLGLSPLVSVRQDIGVSADDEEKGEEGVGLGTHHGGSASPSHCLEGSGLEFSHGW